MRTLFASLIFIAVLAANVSAQAPASTPTPSSAPASPSAPPKMDLLDLKGSHHSLDEYTGKVLVLNFWATYCVPCASEMPMLSQMQKRYKDKIRVLAVSVDDELDRAKLQPFLHKHQADNLTLLVGPTVVDLSDWKLGNALPTTLFIDSQGEIAGKVEGALKKPDLEKRLAEMTGEPVAANSAKTKKVRKAAEQKSPEK